MAQLNRNVGTCSLLLLVVCGNFHTFSAAAPQFRPAVGRLTASRYNPVQLRWRGGFFRAGTERNPLERIDELVKTVLQQRDELQSARERDKERDARLQSYADEQVHHYDSAILTSTLIAGFALSMLMELNISQSILSQATVVTTTVVIGMNVFAFTVLILQSFYLKQLKEKGPSELGHFLCETKPYRWLAGWMAGLSMPLFVANIGLFIASQSVGLSRYIASGSMVASACAMGAVILHQRTVYRRVRPKGMKICSQENISV